MYKDGSLTTHSTSPSFAELALSSLQNPLLATVVTFISSGEIATISGPPLKLGIKGPHTIPLFILSGAVKKLCQNNLKKSYHISGA